MPFGCSATLRSLSHSLQFLLIPHGSYCVLHATSFISPFLPLHYTSFAANPFASRLGPAIISHWLSTGGTPAFPQAATQACLTVPGEWLTGFHSASLRHSFTSVAFSPPAAHNLLAVRSHFGCVHLASANCSCRTSISQSIAKVLLHSSAASVPWREIYSGGFLWRQHRSSTWLCFFSLTQKGAATLLLPPHGCSQARPVVPPSRALRRLASSASAPQVCGARLCFFFAAGAFTAQHSI